MSVHSLTIILDRLDRALDRLDAAVTLRLKSVEAVEFGALEKARLEAALAEARDGERRARQTAETVAARLDGAIDRLKTLLEGSGHGPG